MKLMNHIVGALPFPVFKEKRDSPAKQTDVVRGPRKPVWYTTITSTSSPYNLQLHAKYQIVIAADPIPTANAPAEY